MRKYPDILLQKALSGKFDHYTVVEEFEHEAVVIPAGYRTNFASMPRWLWPVFPPHGRMAAPSVVHDYWYDNRFLEEELGGKSARALADRLFLTDMIDLQVPVWQAVTVYTIVRLFGKKYWDK